MPREPSAIGDKIVFAARPSSWEAEQYRVLEHALFDRRRADALRTIAITSAAAGDGKTVTAVNFAATVAERARVLLIDADLRCGTVASQLGCNSTGPGLVGAIMDESLALKDVLISPPNFLRLSIVPATARPTWAHQLLRSPRLGRLVEQAKTQFDYIIFDTPPVVPVADCRALAQWVDGFVLVVAAHKTPRKLVQEALAMIEPGKLLGLVFNGDDTPIGRGPNRYYQQWSLPKQPSSAA